HDALRREFDEETGLAIEVGDLRYVSESYDRSTATHFLSVAFDVKAQGEPRTPLDDAHVVGLAWASRDGLAEYLAVRVVREPLLAHLGDGERRYFAFADAGVSIEFADEA
ncbi:MAG: NUDIX hydrolase, partial [Candidatus Eremiobacteraeota bacterium]|nr:NUDIX hydrolase [Candidatus Eremiobacteraeota bacterium]